MNVHNIAVVFTPCFFRARVAGIEDLMYSGRFASLLKEMLTNFDQISPTEGKIIEEARERRKSKNKEVVFRSKLCK